MVVVVVVVVPDRGRINSGTHPKTDLYLCLPIIVIMQLIIRIWARDGTEQGTVDKAEQIALYLACRLQCMHDAVHNVIKPNLWRKYNIGSV